MAGIQQKIGERSDAKGSNFLYLQIIPCLPAIAYADMNLPAAELWRLYRGRADCESHIKELKYDFGEEKF